MKDIPSPHFLQRTSIYKFGTNCLPKDQFTSNSFDHFILHHKLSLGSTIIDLVATTTPMDVQMGGAPSNNRTVHHEGSHTNVPTNTNWEVTMWRLLPRVANQVMPPMSVMLHDSTTELLLSTIVDPIATLDQFPSHPS